VPVLPERPSGEPEVAELGAVAALGGALAYRCAAAYAFFLRGFFSLGGRDAA
jgi:hypothetical protein